EFFAGALGLFALGGGIGFGGADSGRRRKREEKIEDALFGSLFGAVGDFIEFFLADHVDGSLDEIADHGFDIPADVADFRVFRSFNLDERATGQASETPGDFGFADAGGANHQNVFGEDVFGDFRR